MLIAHLYTWKYLTLFQFVTSSTELIEPSPLLILNYQKQITVDLALFTTNNIATGLTNQVNNQSLKNNHQLRDGILLTFTQTMTTVQFVETSLSSGESSRSAAVGRLARGQTRLAPLVKRSTCSKSGAGGGGGGAFLKIFFRLNPPLLSHCRQQSYIRDSHPVDLLIYLVMFVFQTLVKTLLGADYIKSTKVSQTVPFVSILVLVTLMIDYARLSRALIPPPPFNSSVPRRSKAVTMQLFYRNSLKSLYKW